jgi:hypothetical protein
MRRLGVFFFVFFLSFGPGCGDDDDGGAGGSGGDASVMDGASGTGGAGGTSGTDGAGGEGGAAGGGTGGIEPMDSGLDGSQETPPTMADLQGTWQGPCVQEGGGYQRIILVFSGNTLTMHLEFHGEATCNGAVLRVEMEMSVAIAGPAGPQAPGAHRLAIEVTSVTGTITNADMVDAANQMQLFEYTDWQANVPRDVSGRPFEPVPDDAGAGGDGLPPVGSQGQLLFRLNPAKDQLQISDIGGGGGGLQDTIYYKQ